MRGRVVLDGVVKRFGGAVAVDHVSLTIEDEEFFVLLCPSGCGKSTILRMIAGLEDPSEGTISIGERRIDGVDAKDRDIAMVFQSYALYPHMTVRRNIEFPLRSRSVAREDRDRLVAEATAALRLEGLLDRKPSQLSGGQRQRVALARAIVRRPVVFLMDEPLSNLDAKLRVQTRAELVDMHRRVQTTIVYVTHDQVEAMTMGHRIAVLDRGRLQQVGPPQEVYDRPANLFVAGFLGSPPMNTAPGEVTPEGGVRVAGGELTVQAAHGRTPVVVGVRPEDLSIDPDGPIGATVAVVESLGHERHVACRLADGSLWTALIAARDTVPHTGDTLRLRPHAGRVHLFDTSTGERIATG